MGHGQQGMNNSLSFFSDSNHNMMHLYLRKYSNLFLEELMPKKVHSGMNILTLKTENTNVEAQIIDVPDNNLQSSSLLSDIS